MTFNIPKEYIISFIRNKDAQATEMEITTLFQGMFEINGISLAYDKNENLLYFYNEKEKFWQERKTEDFRSDIHKEFKEVMKKLIVNRNELQKISEAKTKYLFGLTLEKLKKIIESLYSSLPSMPEIKTPDFIPLKNGYIDLKTLEFKAPKKEIYNRYVIPFDYNEDYKEPKLFLKFMEQVQPKESHREFLLNWLAYFLVPSNPRQKTIFMIGDGANGKGVLIKLMTTLLGVSNCSTVAIPQLHLESYQIPHLKNKMVNFSPDSDDKDQINIGALKALTGGDRVMVRIISKDPFEFTYTGKLVFQVNKMPYFRKVDSAVLRRIEILQFVNIVAEKDRIEDFEEKILADGGSGIFMLLLNRARELAKIGFKFKAPQEVVEYSKMLIEDTDAIHNFFCDLLEVEDKNHETLEFRKTKKEFYEEYAEFCKSNGFKTSNSATFKNDLATYFKKREDWQLQEIKSSGIMNWKFVKEIPF